MAMTLSLPSWRGMPEEKYWANWAASSSSLAAFVTWFGEFKELCSMVGNCGNCVSTLSAANPWKSNPGMDHTLANVQTSFLGFQLWLASMLDCSKKGSGGAAGQGQVAWVKQGCKATKMVNNASLKASHGCQPSICLLDQCLVCIHLELPLGRINGQLYGQ